MIDHLKGKTIGYPFWLGIFLMGFIFMAIFVVNPFITTLEAKGEQSDSRQILLQVYRSLYSYKTENGIFPNTNGKRVLLKEISELKIYLKNNEEMKKIDNTELFIMSNEEQFHIILQKKLLNGDNDVQVLNSKKLFCHKLDGVKHITENCLNA